MFVAMNPKLYEIKGSLNKMLLFIFWFYPVEYVMEKGIKKY